MEAAERLVAFAEADEILISPETQRLVASFFESEARGPFPVKPKTKPVTIYCVLKESGAHTRLEAAEQTGLTRYTGRNNELGTLGGALAAAIGGEGQFVTVVGDAGVGKSRLLLEFQRGLAQQPVTVLQGRCQSWQTNIPYLPFIDLLRDALNLREGDAPAELLANAVSGIRAIDANLESYIPVYLSLLSLQSDQHPLADHLRGEELRVAIREALAAICTLKAKGNPAVIFLEDWHWADDASEETLKRLAGMLSAYPLLVVVTCRPERSFDWLYSVPLIRHASVIGREFNRPILERVLGDTAELPRRLEKLQMLGLIQQTQVLPEPAYRFKHVLT